MHHADRIFRGETTLEECVLAANNIVLDADDDDPSTESANSVLLLLKTIYDQAKRDMHAFDTERLTIKCAAEDNRMALKQEQLNDYLRRRLKGGVWEDIARNGMCQVGFVLARFKEADARMRSHQLSRGTLDKIFSELQPILDLVANMDMVDLSALRHRTGSTALHP
jgi:hypothetical protein